MLNILKKMILPEDVRELLENKRDILIPNTREELLELAMGGADNKEYAVGYDVPGKGEVVEADVVKCKNGISINYRESYMRRRDPNSMVIGDNLPTDKPTYKERFGTSFDNTRQETFEWLQERELIIIPFLAGGSRSGYESIMIAPKNAAFFALALVDLQAFIPADEVREGFEPKAVVYIAPPFRHTHFDGKQVVVHNRLDNLHEVFSYNLYPGPSAKKGIYAVLLDIGEREGWVTLHASTVRAIAPNKKVTVIMHEGASGGGKSEMAEEIPNNSGKKLVLGTNLVTKEKAYITIKENSELRAVTDDMATCHPKLQKGNGKLAVTDGEEGWFLRINHITEYGSDPHYEKMTIHPQEPLVFLNMQGKPDATCLIWEHTIDEETGKPCPNPRVILPRRLVPNIVEEPVEVDIRSFGVRAPMCTKENPTYGIFGMFHIIPPALAWLWRLVAPRGHANPSVVDDGGMKSEGVGSYWPFATGKKVEQANLLLKQIKDAHQTRYILTANQHIGAYEVKFMSQWASREYLVRRESDSFAPDEVEASRCALLGYSLKNLEIDGSEVPQGFLRTNLQPEIGEEGYDKGARILSDFFKRELEQYLTEDLDPLGREIIECCLNDGTVEDYVKLIPINL